MGENGREGQFRAKINFGDLKVKRIKKGEFDTDYLFICVFYVIIFYSNIFLSFTIFLAFLFAFFFFFPFSLFYLFFSFLFPPRTGGCVDPIMLLEPEDI